jgi:hypothetical protein
MNKEEFNIQFDNSKRDLSLNIEFFGAMNIGFAITLLDDATGVSVLVPEIITDSIVKDNLITTKKAYTLCTPPIAKPLFFMFEGLCRGLDANNLDFLIKINPLQDGQIIGSFQMKGKLKVEELPLQFDILFKP